MDVISWIINPVHFFIIKSNIFKKSSKFEFRLGLHFWFFSICQYWWILIQIFGIFFGIIFNVTYDLGQTYIYNDINITKNKHQIELEYQKWCFNVQNEQIFNVTLVPSYIYDHLDSVLFEHLQLLVSIWIPSLKIS